MYLNLIRAGPYLSGSPHQNLALGAGERSQLDRATCLDEEAV